MASKNISTSIVIGGAITGSLRSAFSTTKKSLVELGAETRRLSNEQRTLANGITTFGRMGKDVDGLREKYVRVTQQLERVRLATDRLARVERAREGNLAQRAKLRGQMVDAVGIGLAAGAPIAAAISFESAMADVRKVVDFSEPNGLKNMSRTILDMSTRLPMAAEEIAQIVALGGQSGIAENELAKFAESAVKMGVAFGITAQEAGQMMAGMRSAFNMNQDEINTLADKMNLLANTTAASESKIASVVSSVGPLGKVAGMAAGEVAALAATLVGMNIDENVAATGIQNFMLALVQGEAATKKQREAMRVLGLDSRKVARGMQEDAQGTIMTVLNAVKRLPADRQASILTQLFGKESIKAIAPLLNVTDQLVENLAKVNDPKLYNGAVDKEFAERAKTTANEIRLLRGHITKMGITLGSVLLPAVNSLVVAAGPMVSSITSLAEQYPRATKAIIGMTTGLVGLRVASLASGYAFTFVKGAAIGTWGAVAKLQAGATLATAKFGGLGGIVRQVGFTLMRTPWGLAAAGLVAAGTLVYREWDRVKSFFSGLWQGLTDGLAPVRERIDWLVERVPILGKGFDLVSGAVSTAIEWFGKLFTPVQHTTEQLEAAGKMGQSFGQMLAKGIEFVLTPLTSLIDGMKWVTDNMDGMLSGAKRITAKAGGLWQSAKSAIGLGEDTTAPAAPQGLEPPEPPVLQSREGYRDNRTYDNSVVLNITQQPGESQESLAKRVISELDRRKQVSQRSSMLDPVGAG